MQNAEKHTGPIWYQRSPIHIRRSQTYYHAFPYNPNPYPNRIEGHLSGDYFYPDAPLNVHILGQDLVLKELHFHTPAEHHLDDQPEHPLELHLVHEIKNPSSGSHLFVIGVWFQASHIPNSRGTKFVQAIRSRNSQVSFDLSKCLPEDTQKFYRYEGSLTTGEFSENVSWLMMHDPVPAPPADLRALPLKPDIPPTPLNRRYVLRSFP